jgi:hypothetical protein
MLKQHAPFVVQEGKAGEYSGETCENEKQKA